MDSEWIKRIANNPSDYLVTTPYGTRFMLKFDLKKWDWCIKPLLDELNIDSADQFARQKRWWIPPAIERRYT
jgi:hypothetical protein